MLDANLPNMIGRHPAMRAVYALVRRLAGRAVPVVIVGETGTGKELVASALHTLACSGGEPFIAVNCAALPESLAEAELFGAERGAYTGAHRRRAGVLEEADGGTLFLDEVCSTPLTIQAKLLRAIETGEFRRVGGSAICSSRFRLVSAVSEPLAALIAAGRLRPDFAYRLAGIQVVLPPLRRRRSDIGLLAEAFVAPRADGSTPRFDAEALELLRRYRWPGNVRELQAVVRRVALEVDGEPIRYEHVLAELGPSTPELLDRDGARAALARAGSVRGAARLLGFPHTTLRRRLRALGLLPERA